MALALEDEKIDTNPLRTFKAKKRQVDEMRELDEDIVDPFTSDEINAILPYLNPQAANYVQFCVWTGLRVEEAIEVKWSDVDEDRRTIEIRRARTRKEVKQPKTKSGRRTVKLLPPGCVERACGTEGAHGIREGAYFPRPQNRRAVPDGQTVPDVAMAACAKGGQGALPPSPAIETHLCHVDD
ncbi:MAG: hypothetical protein E2O65_04205 [Gammaproteobacteria bacterium]|nr:MAG: hypothetical protein E2O65_04205 [Gammaproteobacteria bacterium]